MKRIEGTTGRTRKRFVRTLRPVPLPWRLLGLNAPKRYEDMLTQPLSRNVTRVPLPSSDSMRMCDPVS